MRKNRQEPIPGYVGWLVLAAWVAFWDASPSTQTMSTAFCPEGRRYGKPIYVIVWGYLTLHLTRTLPAKYDPLRRLDLLPWKIPTQGGPR